MIILWRKSGAAIIKALLLDREVPLTLKNKIRQVKYRNAVPLLFGSKNLDKYIFYTAHRDFSGARDNLHLFFKIGYRLSKESTFPNWKEGSESKAKREADMDTAKNQK